MPTPTDDGARRAFWTAMLDEADRFMEEVIAYPLYECGEPMASPFVAEHARRNRQEITALLGRHGFVAYPWEFWHYSDGDAYAALLNRIGRPARYGPVHMNPTDGSVQPIADPCVPLNTREAIEELMERVLATRS